MREWAKAWLASKGGKVSDKDVAHAEVMFKTAAKFIAYNTGDARFSSILLPNKGTHTLTWHDFNDIINLCELEFPRVFGVEPPPMEVDKNW